MLREDSFFFICAVFMMLCCKYLESQQIFPCSNSHSSNNITRSISVLVVLICVE